MYRVLVVGCGGSGAQTLAYMMDQLRADLAVYGIEEIPGCWQFIHVDTPIQEERPKMVPPVSAQGGRYVSCGVTTGQYSVVDSALVEKVQARGSSGLRDLATWVPRRAADVTVPIHLGAGQYRQIGRLVILTKLDEITSAVRQAVEAMGSPEALRSAAQTAAKVPGMGSAPAPNAAPMVLVVSSMAGGSGASMTLDVCRLIAGAGKTLATPISSDNISVFLYTAEVFNNVPSDARQGMPGNTLAMLGEMSAAQAEPAGACAQVDVDLYDRFGVQVHSAAFKRVTPIGLTAGGTGAVFGDGTTDGVFRGMGRGLARYISSPVFQSFVSFDIGNPVDVPNRSMVSWGVPADRTVWSSFGYASLSMGRDRYAEYVSQRLARRVLDHLVEGFRLPGDPTPDTQRLADLWGQRAALETERMCLVSPSGRRTVTATGSAVDQGTIDWLLDPSMSAVTNRETLRNSASSVVTSVLAQLPRAEGMPVAEWAGQVGQWLAGREAGVRGEMDRVAGELALGRAHEIAEAIVAGTRETVADFGLPYGRTVLDRVGGPGGLVEGLVASLVALQPDPSARPLALPASVSSAVAQMGKANLAGAGMEQLMASLEEGLRQQVFDWLCARTSELLGTSLADLRPGVVRSLSDTLENARRVLERERAQTPQGAGVASVATSVYQAWPGEPDPGQDPVASVPGRFAVAHNEVVLMPVSQYPGSFERHVRDSVAQAPDLRSAYAQVVREVLTGAWEQGAGAPAPDNMLTARTQWVPAGMTQYTGAAMVTAASFDARLSSEDVLSRARAWVWRTGEIFQSFCSQSLRGFLADPGAGSHELTVREDAVLAGLKEAMEMARPLADIDKDLYARLHAGTSAATFQRDYRFSALPVTASVVQELIDHVTNGGMPDVDSAELSTRLSDLQEGTATSDVSRIDVFGSFSRTLPVAYRGLLDSVGQAWHQAASSPGARNNFWQWRRARPLAACVPLGDAERRAIVRGWWIASLCGGIDRPVWGDRQADYQPVRVWDREEQEWVAFPCPLLTPPSQMRAPNAMLPALLESVLLAYLEVPAKGLDAFRPWAVLRRWVDDGVNEPLVMFGVLSAAQKNLGALLATGSVDGLTGAVDLSACTSVEERRTELLAHCDKLLAYIDEHYLPGPGKRDESGWFTNYKKRELIETTPLTVDLAQEMHDELAKVRSDLATLPAHVTEATSTAGADPAPVVNGGMEF
ncbi:MULTISPECIES: tubulin-like doman-containing protein [Actinomyces]|uniref:Tubulin-like protein n=1 Tax=Actinomyces respiraculi TaxID=2744574 RepID=A0A7T0LKN4_9ACTO|nr:MULTISPECIES: tubulin-like doman-containing protein [Actinomyces]QPL04923.1 tubulin-like protein [Actinomyces respiraculi]